MFYKLSRQCPSGTVAYTIKPGDNFYKLSLMFNTTIQAIIAANPGVNPLYLKIGQQICIPSQGIPYCPEGNSYTIKIGDILYKIASLFNISVDDLIEANPGINPNRLSIGQVICIPLATPPVTCPLGIFSYVVQRGDTFYSISVNFRVSVQELQLANRGINPNALLIGQKLCIPKTGNRFTSETLNINFLYPLNWRRVGQDRYEGVDGFFQAEAISGASLDQVCSIEAYHTLNPYGTQPTIVKTQIQGQEACFIFPYPDQPPEMKGQSALIVRYPKPISIYGNTYNFFILWADYNHNREIANTVTFLIPS